MMPPSAQNSAEHSEDEAMPDIPSDIESGPVKPEPKTSPPLSGDESSDKKDLKNLFTNDDDEDLIGDDDDGADLVAAEAALNVPISTDYSDPSVMRAFYQRLFPWRTHFQWLNHSPIPSKDFQHREIAFELQNKAFIRHRSFNNFEQLRTEVLKLNPARFEIGPVYSANPRDHKALGKSVCYPIRKELVFDIDLTDYDDVRTCCDKANICNKCWRFITVAIKIIDTALRDDFGFRHIMWVYSGRRGAHAWVSDKRAFGMDDAKRRALANYLEVVKGGGNGAKRVQLRRPLHPHLSRSLEVLKSHFSTDVLRNQDPWRTPEKAKYLLSLLPDKTLAEKLREKWERDDFSTPSSQKWSDIDSLAKSGVSRNLNAQALREAKQDVLFEYLYPRLDIKVSTGLVHLLKSPFVVHPGTGRVCVPIDHTRPEEFDPMTVPTVTQLLGEIDAWGRRKGGEEAKEGKGERKTEDYEKTSLKPFVEYFKRHVAAILKDEAVAVKREREETVVKKQEMGADMMEF